MNSIIVTDVSKRFGENQVISELNYSFAPSSRTCIMGESGIGKTTLLNLIMGLIRPDNGSVDGVPNCISAVFQEDRLCENFTAVGNVLAVTGKSVTRPEIIACLQSLGLSGREEMPVSALSGGMRRRVAIARALLAESELILLDEPFKGLDDATRESVIGVILSRTKGKTLIIATHDIRDAELLNADILKLK